MSAFGKILAPIVVPTGGWDFAFNDGSPQSVTIPAGTYDTILHLAAELEDQIQALGGGHATDTVVISSAGICTINMSNPAMNWASTSDALEAALGFETDESFSGGSMVATNQHTHGWYPGTISLGTDRGVGVVSDTEWMPDDVSDGVIAGSGSQAKVGPSRSPYRRTLTFGKVTRTEMIHQSRGPICLRQRWLYDDLYWYPDRSDGEVNSYGTQGDPADYENDDDCDYYLVSIIGEPQITQDSQNPHLFTVQVIFNAEPD